MSRILQKESSYNGEQSEILEDPIEGTRLVRQLPTNRYADGARLIILITIIVAIIAASFVSLVMKDAKSIIVVWGILGPIVGRISAYFFPVHGAT